MAPAGSEVILIRPLWAALLSPVPAQPESRLTAASSPNHLMWGE
jgi:hypothetical protein